MATVNSEIGIGRQDKRVRERFGHSHKAGVSEAHGNVCVLLHELQHRLEILRQLEPNEHRAAAKERTQSRHPVRAEQMESFRQSRLARGPRGLVLRRLAECPSMMVIAMAKQRHHEAGVNENACGHSR